MLSLGTVVSSLDTSYFIELYLRFVYEILNSHIVSLAKLDYRCAYE